MADFGQFLDGTPQSGMPGMNSDPMAKLAALRQDPAAYDALVTKLAQQGTAPPLGTQGSMTGVPGMTGEGMFAATPRDAMSPTQAVAAGQQIDLGNSAQYIPNLAQQAPLLNPNDLGSLLAGGAGQLPGLPQQQTVNPGAAHSYGSTNMAKAPGYQAANIDPVKMKALGELLR